MTAITPLDSLARRIPIVAKLKNGATKGNRPVSIDKWRATTSSRPWAENFAARYGGEVKSFSAGNSPHQWEVFSESDEVAIALLDDGYSINYELWSAGGCQRRCNGVTASVLQTTGPDNVEYVDAPCICDRKGVLECSLKSRLTFVLPDLPFAGGVVYETSSKNFAEESQGMLALIQQMQASGITRGVLRLEQRKSSGGRRYTMAVVGVTSSLEEIAAGGGARALGSAPEPKPELSSPPPEDAVEEEEPAAPPSAGSSEPSEPEVTDGEAVAPGEEDIVDAEVVEDDESTFRLEKAERARYRAAFMARAKGLGLSYEGQIRPWLQSKYGLEGEDAGWSELTDEQAHNLYHALIVPEGTQKEKDDAGERFKRAVLGEVTA